MRASEGAEETEGDREMGRDRDGHKMQVGGAVSQRAGDLVPCELPWPLQVWPPGQAVLGGGDWAGVKSRWRGAWLTRRVRVPRRGGQCSGSMSFYVRADPVTAVLKGPISLVCASVLMLRNAVD